jgi:hypothetical protein
MPPTTKKEIILEPEHWFYSSMDITEHSKDIKINMYEDDKLINNITVLIDKDWIKQQKNKRQIIFK